MINHCHSSHHHPHTTAKKMRTCKDYVNQMFHHQCPQQQPHVNHHIHHHQHHQLPYNRMWAIYEQFEMLQKLQLRFNTIYLYVFENDFYKTRVTKSAIFKENAETVFCWELREKKLETKTIVYKKQTICQYSTRLSTLQFLL